jgi:sugar/nucleoside kinase (ribokinase family)
MMRLLLFTCLLATAAARAGEVRHAEVEYKDERYFVSFEVYIEAPRKRVRELLTDYAHLPRISHVIKESELYFSLDENSHRIRVVVEGCVTYFCKRMTQVQDVEELGNGIITGTVLAEKSDFIYAHSRWKIAAHNTGTVVSFDSDFKPKFWVPPVIGPYLIKKKLREITLETINGLEQLANDAR